MIKCKIDVTKIDKARIFVGEKGKYIDITLIETPNDKYGNSHMIVQDVTKEERLAGVKGPILGNAKTFGARPTQPQQQSQPSTSTDSTTPPKKGGF